MLNLPPMKVYPMLLKSVTLLGVALMLSSCSPPVTNEFIVNDPQAMVTGGEINLCGQRTPLHRDKALLKGMVEISCEGEGNISLRLNAGNSISCHIGYVTPGAHQTFDFSVQDGECRSDGNR